MAVKVINNTAGLDGLVLTLLVFSIFPRMNINNILLIITIERDKTIRKAIKEVIELYAKRYVMEALRTHNGPNITEILGLVISEKVLVWRENKR